MSLNKVRVYKEIQEHIEYTHVNRESLVDACLYSQDTTMCTISSVSNNTDNQNYNILIKTLSQSKYEGTKVEIIYLDFLH